MDHASIILVEKLEDMSGDTKRFINQLLVQEYIYSIVRKGTYPTFLSCRPNGPFYVGVFLLNVNH